MDAINDASLNRIHYLVEGVAIQALLVLRAQLVTAPTHIGRLCCK